MFNDSQMFALLQGFQTENPRIHDLLKLIIQEVQIQNAALFPPQTSLPEVITPGTEEVSDVTVFDYSLIKQGIRFTWERPSSNVVFFEIRRGATWETASRQLVTSTLSAVLDPQLTGSYTYWISGISLAGEYSVNALPVNVIIPIIGGLTVNGRVIDNNVLLTWTVPISAFAIDYYVITRDSSPIGRQAGTFIAVFEQVAGTYRYGVQAVDTVGNVSIVSEIELSVSQPPDYILEALETSDLDGTFTNTLREATLPSLLANINLTETWEGHFTSRGWNTIQNQLDAGFPYFLQPTMQLGEYEEVFDYGAVFDNIIVNLEWNFEQIVPTMNVVTYLSSSVDNVTYTSEITGITIFATSLRYLKVRFEFEAQN